MRKILILIISLFSFSLVISAQNYKGCSNSDVARLRNIINNINLSYDYTIENGTPMFSVTINNLIPELYFVDSYSKNTYTYTGDEVTIGGYVGNGGRYDFYSAREECYGIKIGTKHYSFPSYNYYYGSDLCEGVDSSICDKWAKVNYNNSEFEMLIFEYKHRYEEEIPIEEVEKTLFEKVLDFYVSYYYFILVGIIIICMIIILIKRNKDKFKL